VQGLAQDQKSASDVKDNIIGQFGVGFYSAFIVSDLVEVVSREAGGPANRWTSDGSGTYEIEEVEE
jgi:HSP90 family molecular chaperone